MKQFILLFLITLINQTNTYAQEHKLEGIFAFVYNPIAEMPDYDQTSVNMGVKKVFDDLIQAKGVRSILPPKLIISDTENLAAWAHPAQNIIGIEEKAIQICRSMKEDSLNAIAALLSHELIHYYEKHDWHNHFIHQYGEAIDGAEKHGNGREIEIEADDMGGILSHMAGYQSLHIMQELLQKIYQEYQLDVNDDSSYPSLGKRIKMAEISRDNLTKMIPLYEISNYMAVTGQVNEARNYLEYIVRNTGFVSREIQNNLGVLYAISAYENRPDKSIEYRLPFQLDINTRLATKGISDDSYGNLVNKAKEYFEAAQLLDDQSASSYVNLASLYILNGEYFDAEYQLHKLKAFDPENSNISMLQGLIMVLKGKVEEGRKMWKEAKKSENVFIQKNLSILNGQNKIKGGLPPSMVLKIDQVDLDKFYARIAQDEVSPKLSIDISKDVSFYTVEMDNSEVYVHMDYASDENFSFFHIIQNEDDQLPMDIGTSEKILLEEFGDPDSIFNTERGNIFNYESLKMLAVIEEGKIRKWCIYKHQSN